MIGTYLSCFPFAIVNHIIFTVAESNKLTGSGFLMTFILRNNIFMNFGLRERKLSTLAEGHVTLNYEAGINTPF